YPKNLSTLFLKPNLRYRYLRPSLSNAYLYHGLLSTIINGLLMHLSKTIIRNFIAISIFLLHDA
ncbi:MAG: hypothetical protein LZ174_08275, partial [Thaumarchaeota archaeon]|nr:hypothetical protein [Candidatus Geocrenenecus arthurdayi]